MKKSLLSIAFIIPILLFHLTAFAITDKPNILVIFDDHIGYWNVSYNSGGMMGYKTPNIDRIAQEGLRFTDYYAEQSCTAGRAAFITGQMPVAGTNRVDQGGCSGSRSRSTSGRPNVG